MAEPRQDPYGGDDGETPGTEAVEVSWDSLATMRPMSTKSVFRPEFDETEGISGGSADTEPHEQQSVATRRWPARRWPG